MAFVPLTITMFFVSIIDVRVPKDTTSKGIFDNGYNNYNYALMTSVGYIGVIVLFIAISINIIETKRFVRFGLEGIHANRPFTVGVKLFI